jgi:exosortase H (IPTLxxWG-CTERM-specific)
MMRFFTVFLLIIVFLFFVEATTLAQQTLVQPFTAQLAAISAFLLQPFDSRVIAHTNTLWNQTSGFGVTIDEGCSGVEASLVLLAAMVAYPSPWRNKLTGLIGGIATVQVLNLIRIISLFYLGQWSEAVFNWAHLYLWQALIMLDVLLVFLLWLRWLPTDKATGPAPVTQ